MQEEGGVAVECGVEQVGWSGMSEGKEGSLFGVCVCVCGLYREMDVYVSIWIKVCFPTVFTPLDTGQDSDGEATDQ